MIRKDHIEDTARNAEDRCDGSYDPYLDTSIHGDLTVGAC
jgi:hypothetical protein